LIIVTDAIVSFEYLRSSVDFMKYMRNKLLDMQMAETDVDVNGDRVVGWQIPRIQLVKKIWVDGGHNSLAIKQALIDWRGERALEEDHN
jgi:hypothetical protein